MGKCRRCAARLEAEALAALADEAAVLRQRTAVERGVHQAPPTSTTVFSAAQVDQGHLHLDMLTASMAQWLCMAPARLAAWP